jgi:hypothetical protein
LATHVSTAKAMVETCVSIITDADLERALKNDNRLFFRLVEARERDFDYLKNTSLNVDLRPPIQRLANFLLAIVSINVSEGREPLIDWCCRLNGSRQHARLLLPKALEVLRHVA